MDKKNEWPELNFLKMQDTLETLHQWIQIVGKIRLQTMPWQNHSWHCTLYITANGFSTYSIPYQGRSFQIDFNFKDHLLQLYCSTAKSFEMELKPRTVADFYEELLDKLAQMDIKVTIYPRPNEIEPAIPFPENKTNKDYDPLVAKTLWQAMLRSNEVFTTFRSGFVGKVSPVHLFWGAFDLAVSRFSGKPAPLHPGGMPNIPLDVMQEAYAKEVSSAGFWPGSKDFPTPLYYSYLYPTPSDFELQEIVPEEAFYSKEMGEFVLPYEVVQKASNPNKTLLDFLQTTYKAAARTANWNREQLERQS